MSDARDSATRLVRALRDAGHVAYFAGGCVRDELLGAEPEDYDIATDAVPERVEELFPKTKAVGKSFGVVLVRTGRIVTEVATFREESGYSDKRRPDDVRFSDATADAQRRDFTINALFLDPLDTALRRGGRIIDYVEGQRDIEMGVVRAVGDPEARLAEDHLRALRAVRFASRLGFEIDERTQGAISVHASELEGVSRERVGDEARRMLAHPNRADAATTMQRLALDAPVLHDGRRPDARLDALHALPENASATEALGAWTLDRLDHNLAPGDVTAHVARLRKALVLANDETDALHNLLLGVTLLRDGWGGARVAQLKRWGGSAWSASALTLLGARDPDRADAIRADLDALARTPSGLSPMPLVDGDTLIEAGLTPGPMFGVWLDRAYDQQLEDRLTSREQALEAVHGWAREADERE